ncbi:hypothetical protein HPB47_010369 [Ixodes persulcatus]|uniref:Uncharacterized protein n=1 Tax=Ixodes persulcatus TaxID=34615 RepID=A0AC60NZ95_IXOPE|nr:hypothetical protein HPB47_010369 [Ixodes persulcatus]
MEGCYTAELLFQMFSDPLNKLYLLYLRPILREVQRANKAYERNDADPSRLLEDLTLLIKTFSKPRMGSQQTFEFVAGPTLQGVQRHAAYTFYRRIVPRFLLVPYREIRTIDLLSAAAWRSLHQRQQMASVRLLCRVM